MYAPGQSAVAAGAPRPNGRRMTWVKARQGRARQHRGMELKQILAPFPLAVVDDVRHRLLCVIAVFSCFDTPAHDLPGLRQGVAA